MCVCLLYTFYVAYFCAHRQLTFLLLFRMLKIVCPQACAIDAKEHVCMCVCICVCVCVCVSVFEFTLNACTLLSIATESNFLDTPPGLAYIIIGCSALYERRTLRDTAHARLQHVDAADKVCAAPGSRHVRVPGEWRGRCWLGNSICFMHAMQLKWTKVHLHMLRFLWEDAMQGREGRVWWLQHTILRFLGILQFRWFHITVDFYTAHDLIVICKFVYVCRPSLVSLCLHFLSLSPSLYRQCVLPIRFLILIRMFLSSARWRWHAAAATAAGAACLASRNHVAVRSRRWGCQINWTLTNLASDLYTLQACAGLCVFVLTCSPSNAKVTQLTMPKVMQSRYAKWVAHFLKERTKTLMRGSCLEGGGGQKKTIKWRQQQDAGSRKTTYRKATKLETPEMDTWQ